MPACRPMAGVVLAEVAWSGLASEQHRACRPKAHQRLSACVHTMPPGASARCMASKKGCRVTEGSRQHAPPVGCGQPPCSTVMPTVRLLCPPCLQCSGPLPVPRPNPKHHTIWACCEQHQGGIYWAAVCPLANHPNKTDLQTLNEGQQNSQSSSNSPSGTAPRRGPPGRSCPPQSHRSGPPVHPAQT